MTESYTLEELISGYFDNEFANIEEVAPRFSIKHKIAMRKIFRKFADNAYNKSSSNQIVYVPSKPRSIRKRLIIVAIIIIGMAILTGFVIMFISNGFKGKVYHDNTHLLAVNTEGCPTTIEKEYELSVLPEGYSLFKTEKGHTFIQKIYENSNGDRIFFTQYTKIDFNLHIDNDGVELQETNINGCNALFMDTNVKGQNDTVIIWDNEEYVLKILSNIDKNDLIKLAKSNEIAGFEK